MGGVPQHEIAASPSAPRNDKPELSLRAQRSNLAPGEPNMKIFAGPRDAWGRWVLVATGQSSVYAETAAAGVASSGRPALRGSPSATRAASSGTTPFGTAQASDAGYRRASRWNSPPGSTSARFSSCRDPNRRTG